MALHENDQVRTGFESRAEIRMADGTQVTVSRDSLIRMEKSVQDRTSRGPQSALSIQAGEANFQTSPTGQGRTTLGTPAVTARVERDAVGSLQVGEGGATGLRLFRGTGEAETGTGQKIVLGANEGLQVAPGGAAGAKTALPPAPGLLAPANLAQITYRDMAAMPLVWAAVAGADRYRVVVDYSPSFTRPLHDRKDHDSAHAELVGLDAGSHFWRVAAVAANGLEGTFSETWQFTLAKTVVRTGPPPVLKIETLELKGSVLHLRGQTEPGATLLVNDEKVRVEADGTFSEFLAVPADAAAEFVLRATSRGGGVAELRRRATAGR
jgi:hypothetical protein